MTDAEKRVRVAISLREARDGWTHVSVKDAKVLLAEIERLRAERDALRTALHDCDVVARQRGDKYGLCDQIDNGGSPYPSQWLADLLAQAKDAEARG